MRAGPKLPYRLGIESGPENTPCHGCRAQHVTRRQPPRLCRFGSQEPSATGYWPLPPSISLPLPLSPFLLSLPPPCRPFARPPMLLRLSPLLLLLCVRLLPLSAAAPNPAPAPVLVPGQIPLRAASAASLGEPISQDLFDELEELSRIVDIAYCVGSLNTGVDKPFECLSFCRNFPSFELKQVRAVQPRAASRITPPPPPPPQNQLTPLPPHRPGIQASPSQTPAAT